MLDRIAAEFPERIYVATDEQQWTYAEIRAWSERLAACLVEAGVERGDRVAVVMANYPAFIALKYAISRVGATCVPVNILNRRDELAYVLRQAEVRALVTMDCFRGNDYLAALDQIAPGWETGGGVALPHLSAVFVFPVGEAPLRQGVRTLSALEASGRAFNGYPDADPDAVSDILYTSGTTGSPKGAMLTHDQYLRAAFGSAYWRAFDDGWKILYALPMYHVFGYAEGMLAAMIVGGVAVPRVRFDPDDMLDAAERHRVDDILMVPTMTRLVLDAQRARPRALRDLKAVLSSGQRSPEGMFDEIFELLHPHEVTTGYGMTETTATTTLTRPEDPRDWLLTQGPMREVGPAGDPALGGKLVDYRVVDTVTEKVAAPGEIGELRAKGPGITQGYYKKPDETAAAFDADGWFRSGDLGFFDEKGRLILAGRLKETYRCGGEQVMPTEIEDVLTSHPDVVQAHVVPVPDERMGETGAAWVVLRDGASISLEDLRARCEASLARFKVPKYVLKIDAADLPTTASGRARKFLLSERAIAQLGLSSGRSAAPSAQAGN
ncbi:acyl--CoA ligase [Zhengella mangrovi]|uniref:Acyl--CoA ligase n=2 Tax=Zhengella mangrovi TaxID=1982044 RepID=A0A2G1QGX3_9HYPH|nr:acyl--CoA ligase [Zhengella mangrovi]